MHFVCLTKCIITFVRIFRKSATDFQEAKCWEGEVQKVLQKDREGNDKDGLKLFLDRIPRQIYGLDLGLERVRIYFASRL